MGPVEIKFSAKELKHAAKLQDQFIQQMQLIGYQFKEFKAVPNGKKFDVTLTLVRNKKSNNQAP